MIRIAAAALALASWATACGRSEGVPDDKLGGLVVEPKPPPKIDVAAAQKDPEELTRALTSSYGTIVAALGPHTYTLETRTVVEEGGKPVNELSDRAVLELGDGGAFHGVYTNSADYGREAIYLPGPATDRDTVPGTLYLRPRYQRWHARSPETTEEPAEIRDRYVGAIGAIWELVAPGAELTERGAVQVAGRDGRKVEVKLTPTPRKNADEALSQRTWRQGRTVESLAGEVVLDAESGVPLAARLTGSVGFTRDGRRFTMKLELDAKVTARGAVAIAAPATGDVVATPERKREVDERDFLLEDIAPPIRKHSDGTAVKPALKNGNGSAAKPEPAKPEPAKPKATP